MEAAWQKPLPEKGLMNQGWEVAFSAQEGAGPAGGQGKLPALLQDHFYPLSICLNLLPGARDWAKERVWEGWWTEMAPRALEKEQRTPSLCWAELRNSSYKKTS